MTSEQRRRGAQAERELSDALTDSGEYDRERRDGVVVFSRDVDEGIGTGLAYALAGRAWVIVQGTLVSKSTAADLAVQAMRLMRSE